MSATSTAAVDTAAPSGDLEALLAPISEEAPAGESLRYDPILDRIRELRREDDPTLPQGVWQYELKKADWKGVEREASEALRTRSKDLQLAGWLTEAWLHCDGLPGLVRGLDLVAGLCEGYWESLYPLPDEPDEPDSPDSREEVAEREAGVDLSLRVAPLGWLAAAVSEALLHLSMTRPRGDDAEPFSWGDWKHALYVENLAATRPEAAAELEGVRRDGFLASAGLTEAAFYHRLAAGAEASLAALARLDAILDRRCGPDAPGFATAREALEGIARFAHRVAADRGEPVPAGANAPQPDPETPGEEPAARHAEGGGAAPSPSSPCTLNSRADAYRALEQAAEFLLRLEPHSPVPYLVRRAVHWGGLSLSELYDELFTIADPKSVFRLLGIREGGEE